MHSKCSKKKTLARQCKGFGAERYREYPGRPEYRRPMETECSKDKPIEQSYKHCLGVHSLLSSNFYFEVVIWRLTEVAEVTDHRQAQHSEICRMPPKTLDIKNPSGRDSH